MRNWICGRFINVPSTSWGLERLVFGTDSSFFPRGWHAAIFDAQVKALYELGLEKEQAEQILAFNLPRVLSGRGGN
jgi:hypothetical protein